MILLNEFDNDKKRLFKKDIKSDKTFPVFPPFHSTTRENPVLPFRLLMRHYETQWPPKVENYESKRKKNRQQEE